MMNRFGRVARSIEFSVAALLTLEIIALRFSVVQHLGPLWRDEISSLGVATMPTLTGLWSALVYDPVPALFFVILRVWTWLFSGAGDESLRYLGFVIGLGIVGALWLAAWCMKKSPPTWSLLLFGLNPISLVWSDSLRAYGLGCLFNILAIGFISQLFCERPRRVHIAWATAAALCSVHSLFPNSLLLFAAAAGAMVVAIYRHWWRTLMILLGIGLVAALSLLPYAPIIRQTDSWSGLCTGGIDISQILSMLLRATRSGGDLGPTLWIVGAVLLCGGCLLSVARPALLQMDERDQNLLLYATITMIVAIVLTLCFLRWVAWTTAGWYYLPMMSTVAVCLDGASRVLRKTPVANIGNSALITIAVLIVSPMALQTTMLRLTNVDLAATTIAQRAKPLDLIVVDNYFYAISFHRYYHGKTPWLSLPEVSAPGLHRWDILIDTMRRPRPLQPVLDRIDQTLRAGHDVYVVGFAPLGHGPSAPADLSPAPAGSSGWNLWPYMRRWMSQIAYAAQTQAAHGQVLTSPCSQPVCNAEQVNAVVVSGWNSN